MPIRIKFNINKNICYNDTIRSDLMNIKKKSNLILGTMVLTAVLYFITAIPAYYNPFFKGSILVGDLNQQYLSFFSYYRHALLGKESILYSFSNGLGGNMIGNWAYYLMSPFNLLLLLVSNKNIPTMVFIIILLNSQNSFPDNHP